MKNFKSNLKQTVRAFPLLVVMLLCSSAVLAVPGWSNTNMTARQSSADELTDRQVSSAWQPTYQGYRSQIFEVGTTNVPSDYSDVSSGSSEEQGGHKGHLRKLGGGTDPGNQSTEYPIGESWIMLLFALLACGVIAYRKMNMKHNKNMINTILNQLFSICKKWKTLVLISTLLTLGIGQMWSADVQKDAIIYMDNSASKWSYSDIYFCINDDKGYQMSSVTNTKLLVHKRTDNTWSGYSYIRFFGANGSWGNPASLGGYQNMHDYGANLSNTYNNYGFNANNYYVIKLSKTGTKDDLASLSITCPGSTLASMNKTITVKAKVSTDGGSSYSEATSPGTLSASSNTFTEYNSCASATSLSSGTISCGYTATTTLTAADATGYDFVGWYNASGEQQTTNKTLTIYPTEDAIYYAYYKAKQTTITLDGNSGTGSSSSVTGTYGFTLPAFTMHTREGYKLDGYYTDASDGTKIINADGTLVASVLGYTDASSKWARDNTTEITLYAHWLKTTITGTMTPNPARANTTELFTFNITFSNWVSGQRYIIINPDGGFLTGPTDISSNEVEWKSGALSYNAGRYTFKLRVCNATKTDAITDDYLITLIVSSSTYSVTVNASAGGTVSPASISASPDSWSGDITATPNAGYRFDNWTSSGGGITIYNNKSATTQVKATSTGGTLTANFSAATYRVTLDNQSATTAGTEYVDATYNTTTLTSITKPTKTNYTFGGYYTETGGNGTQIIDADGNWLANQSGFTDGSNKSLITENKTLYAKWTETTYAVTVAVDDVSHADGNIACSAAGWEASKSGTAQIGSLTNVTITVGAAAAGYKFDGGYWTLTDGVTLVSGSLTDPSITVKATAEGSAIYTYAEVLSTTWTLRGSFVDDFVTAYDFVKKSGEATGNVAYATVTLSANTTYQFKVVNNGDTWYGNNNSEGGGTHYIKGNVENWEFKTGDGNCYMESTLAGTYTFKIDFSAANPKVSVYYPEIYAISGDFNSWTEATNLVFDGNVGTYEVDLTARETNYEFKVLDNGSWYGLADKTFKETESDVTLSPLKNIIKLYANVYPSGTYTFTYDKSTHKLSVTYPTAYSVTYDGNGKTSGDVPAVSYHIPASDVTLATNYDGILYKEGYAFNGWNTAADGSGTHYNAGGTLSSIGANTTLYAEWVKNDYTMYFYNKDSWSPMTAYLLATNYDREMAWGGRTMAVHQGNVYKIDYNHSVQEKVIFNNNATGGDEHKTDDLTIADKQTGNNWFYNDDDKGVNTGGIHHGWSQYILVANFPTSTVAAVVGEKVTVIPTVVWADGINFADINITSTRDSGSAKINAFVSGTNIIVSGSEAGTATFNITYTYSTHTEATITKTLTVKVMNGLTIQAKIPSDDNYWKYSNIVKMHYWGGAGTDDNPSFEGDVTMSWIKDGADGKYYQACVPVGTEATPETNFIFFYDNFNDAWRKTQDVTDVTKNSCYTINHTAGLDNQRNAVKEGTGLCNDSWSIQITMGSGDIYTSNIVETSDEIVSFFAPSNESETNKSYRQGVVTIERNGTFVATVPANTFAASGVYTAKIDMTNPASPSLTNVALYDGNYYIRTDGAAGGWDNYKTNPANLMTEFTRNPNFPNESFSYYWVANVGHGVTQNIKGTVANDYNSVLCSFSPDETANEPDGINLRFGYEPTTNDLVRGIIGGSTTNNFLNVVCATGSQIYKEIDCETLLNEEHYVSNPFDSKFQDKSNWVYEIIVYAKIDDAHKTADVVLKSFYKGIHYLLGMEKDAEGHDTFTPVSVSVIKTGTTNGVYGLRVVYDFKTNRLFAAWVPADLVIDGELEIDADVMFLRHEDSDAAQISFKTDASSIKDIKQAIFALELDNEDTNHKGSGNIERHYFISLPFDCKVSNIFGIGGFMNYWGIQRYNGAKRAQIGWFQDTPTFWEWMSPDDVMKAGEGYLLSVDKKALENGNVWKDGIIYQKQQVIIDPSTEQPYKAQDGSDSIAWVTHTDGSMLTLYFPSTTSGFTITPATGAMNYPDQPCSITRDDRDKKDSNWKCIGTPGYKNITITGYNQESEDLVYMDNKAPNFLYEFHEQTTGATWEKGTYTVADGSKFTYHSFHSYMVQFAGTINWAQYSKGDVASPIAPKRMPTADTKTTKVEIELLSSDDDALDRTFIWLQENATTGFDQNYDLNKMIEKKANQIYSLAENEVPFAANVLPLGTDTVTLVVNIANEGEYTFSLNADKHVGMAPVLYDMYKSEQINLLNSDYLVELEKGKYEDRFFLLFQPEAPIVTNFETTVDGGQNVHSSEAIYDVLGRRVNTIYPGHLYIVNGEKRIAK